MSENRLESAVSARESRVLAFLIDFVLLTIVTAMIWVVFLVIRTLVGFGGMLGMAALSGSGTAAGSSTAVTPAASLGSVVLGWGLGLIQWVLIGLVLFGYFTFMLESRGQTLGMSITDVTLVSEDSTDPTQSQAMKRTAVLLAPLPLMALSSVFIPLVGLPLALFMMVAWLAIEAVVLFVDDSAQRLGDRFADTLVVDASA